MVLDHHLNVEFSVTFLACVSLRDEKFRSLRDSSFCIKYSKPFRNGIFESSFSEVLQFFFPCHLSLIRGEAMGLNDFKIYCSVGIMR